jgi:molybdopterin synthase sulfur carrier subunit
MALLRLFAGAREAAGTAEAQVPGATVADVLAAARERFGSGFADVLDHCQVWCNGEPTAPDALVGEGDEVAVLPPVSGGAA